MAELLAIPVGLVIYDLIVWLLPVGLSKTDRKIVLGVARVVTFSIIALLMYLIYH